MDKLQAMTTFIAVAEEQSFAEAARKLRMSPPAVTRAVTALESRLGTILLLRTTRRVRLTEVGQQYLLDARRILAELESAEESVTGAHGTPQGNLVITAPAMFGRLYVIPIITAYLKQYEHVSVSAVFVDRVSNLIEEGIDIGIRIGELPDSSLRAIRVGSVMAKTYASPEYLKRFGVPKSPEELHRHRLIVSTAGSGLSLWRFSNGDQEIKMKVVPAFTSNTNDSAIAATLDGYGITRVLSYQAAPQLESGNLVAILEDYDGPPIPVSIVHLQGRNVPAKVRVFIDMAVNELKTKDVLMSN